MEWLQRCWASATMINKQPHSSFHYTYNWMLSGCWIHSTCLFWESQISQIPSESKSGTPRVSHPWSPLEVSRKSCINDVVSSTPLVFLWQWVACSFLVMLWWWFHHWVQGCHFPLAHFSLPFSGSLGLLYFSLKDALWEPPKENAIQGVSFSGTAYCNPPHEVPDIYAYEKVTTLFKKIFHFYSSPLTTVSVDIQ